MNYKDHNEDIHYNDHDKDDNIEFNYYEDNNEDDNIEFNYYEDDHVHKFYSKHASDFNITRVKTWPKIASFLKENDKPGFVNLDAGCGNGRNLKRDGDSIWIGLDYSMELLQCIHSTDNSNTHNKSTSNHTANCNLVRGDCLSLPYKDHTFDLILSIAVIHHFSTMERRSWALREMRRILKSTGKILLYVWDENTKRKSKFKQIDGKDYLVKFNGVFDRYYYLYDLEEIEGVCRENGFEIEESGIEQESIYLILTNKK